MMTLVAVYAHEQATSIGKHIPYLLDQMPRLLFISSINFVWLLFKSGDYSRAAFILFSMLGGMATVQERLIVESGI